MTKLSPRWSRRTMLRGAVALGGGGVVAGSAAGVFAATSAHAVSQPEIHNRNAWQARDPKEPVTVVPHRPSYIVIHHTATANSDDFSLEHAFNLQRSRQNYHMDERGYIDIGDQFSVSRGGHKMVSRHRSLPMLNGGEEFIHGGHAAGANGESIGIENEGTYTDVAPPDQQYLNLVVLCAYICAQYGIAPDNSGIVGHRDAGTTPTECPGEVFYGMLPQLRQDVAAQL